MLEGGREKFLVFAHHKLVLDHITAELGKKVGKTCRHHVRGCTEIKLCSLLRGSLSQPLGQHSVSVGNKCGQQWARWSSALCLSAFSLLSFTTRDY